MPRPRPVLAEQFYLITRRCSQRMFLLHPDHATTNAFIYCLALAVQLCGIEVLGTCAMSNHHHTVIYDRYGIYPAFIEHFHKLLARSQNALRRRRENFWASGQCSVVRLVDREAVMEKLVYCLTNPVKDLLVAKVHQWPGANSFVAMRTGRTMCAKRPRHFFRKNGPTPGTVELELTLPDVLGERGAVVRELVERVRVVEETCAKARHASGHRTPGRRKILRAKWDDVAKTEEPRSELSPTIACRDREARLHALCQLRAFRSAYRDARKAWLHGGKTVFPPGTYWLRRFAAVPLCSD
jgi:putative transposase